MKKPVILITPQKHDVKNFALPLFLYATTSYNFDWVTANGGIPVMPTFLALEDAEEAMARCDGLFVTGGADVDPALYGEEKKEYCDATEPDRDRSDFALIEAALKLSKPILCVCRGSQIGNVYFGGSLYQDLTKELGDKVIHPDYAPYRTEDSHIINVVKGTPLYELFGEESFGINSLHHQGIKTLGKGVKAMATAPDGLVESWYYDRPGRWVRAYQWHPEMQDENRHNKGIIADFISRCSKNL